MQRTHLLRPAAPPFVKSFRRLGFAAAVTLLTGLAAPAAASQGYSYALPRIPAGVNLDQVCVAKLDGNALPDFVVYDDLTDTVFAIAATGAGTYGAPTAVPTPYGARSLTVADVNLDGTSDAILTAFSGTGNPDLAIYLGNGAGSFLPPIPAGTQSSAFDVAEGDVNGDGKPDVVALSGLHVRVYLGTGTGSFGGAAQFPTGFATTKKIRLADVNQDGVLDIAVIGGTTNGILTRSIGNGTGGFGAFVNYSAGANPWAFATSDVNADGVMDVAVANYTSISVSVIHGAGGGTFAPPLTIQTDPSPTDIDAIDLDGDGFVDLATCHSGVGTVRVLTNFGGAGFVPGATYSTVSGAFALDTADLDGNGTVDFAVALNQEAAIALLLRDAAGNIATPGLYSVGVQPESIVSGDLDHDGFADLLTADSASDTCTVLLWHGSGTIVNPISLPSSGSPQAAALADYNGDGKLDAVTAHYATNELRLRIGDGMGGLADVAGYPVGTKPQACIALDYNGDGFMDAAAANSGSGTVSILLGNGAGVFVSNASYPVGVNPRCLAAADFDGDGFVDLAAASNGSSTVNFILGSSSGIPVSSWPPLTVASGLYWIVAADFNLDGFADVATNRFERWTGDGLGGFALTAMPAVGNLVTGIAADDVNADGWLDILTANFDHGSVGILTGTAGGGYSPPQLFGAAASPIAVATRDLNLDGRPDWFTALLYENAVSTSLNLEAAPQGLTSFGTGTSGCFGQLSLLANGPPAVPSPGFALTCTNAPSLSLGLLLVADASHATGFDPFGIGALLHVDPFSATELLAFDLASNAAGTARGPAPIPSVTALVGAVYHVQALFVEKPGLTCGPSPFHLVSSMGSTLVLQ